MSKLYTLGYLNDGAMSVLEGLIASGAVLLDIRYQPFSRRPQWRKERLFEHFGASYHHLRELGNVNYRSAGLPVHLVDAPGGVYLVKYWLEKGYDVCLLCACRELATCHRLKVADLVKANCPCEVVHLVGGSGV